MIRLSFSDTDGRKIPCLKGSALFSLLSVVLSTLDFVLNSPLNLPKNFSNIRNALSKIVSDYLISSYNQYIYTLLKI